MNLKEITNIAASGLAAQRTRLAATASNIANAETTRTEGGGPYRRRDPVFRTAQPDMGFAGSLSRAMRSVEVVRMNLDDGPPVSRFSPGHPDADENGFVDFPRVHVVQEMANLMSASRSYESNLLIIRKARQMADAALRIGR